MTSFYLFFTSHSFEILSGNVMVLIFRPGVSNSVRVGLYKREVIENQSLN